MYDTGILANCEDLRRKLPHLCLHGFSGPFGTKCRFFGFGKTVEGYIATLCYNLSTSFSHAQPTCTILGCFMISPSY